MKQQDMTAIRRSLPWERCYASWRIRRPGWLWAVISVAVISSLPRVQATPWDDQGIHTWSLDIGSDTELSDPFADGDEGGDPGDVYQERSADYRPPGAPCGRDGFKDDAFIFGVDPSPSPPDCSLPPATAVPVGSNGNPDVVYAQYFDLDGHDQIEFDTRLYVSPTAPADVPIARTQITLEPEPMCVHVLLNLGYSYDDDQAAGWPANDVPVTATSPAGETYGDEFLVINAYWTHVSYSETQMHSNMTPVPNAGLQERDDDVDSLDVLPYDVGCPFWYFSADHEAHFGLDPGSIYLATGVGAPIQVIDDVIHLGLPESTDIDALEFAWLPTDQVPGGPGGLGLAVLFSVDEDDPLTPVDESGNLDAKQIYGSFLTGSNFPVIVPGEEPTDDVDALAVWITRCSDYDVNCDGFVNATDIGIIGNGANF